jgi:hypothetical protein
VRDTLSELWRKFKRLWKRDPEPQDPYAGVRAPLKRGPRDRSSAVALAEPDETGPLFARGRPASGLPARGR